MVLIRKPLGKDEEVSAEMWEEDIVGRPGRLLLVPRVDHHHVSPTLRMRVHLPLRVLLRDHPQGCGGEEDSPPEGPP